RGQPERAVLPARALRADADRPHGVPGPGLRHARAHGHADAPLLSVKDTTAMYSTHSSFSAATLLSALAALAATACAPAAPANPTWEADVAPILAANCVRCHRSPAVNGAPNNFRLDICEEASGVLGAS